MMWTKESEEERNYKHKEEQLREYEFNVKY